MSSVGKFFNRLNSNYTRVDDESRTSNGVGKTLQNMFGSNRTSLANAPRRNKPLPQLPDAASQRTPASTQGLNERAPVDSQDPKVTAQLNGLMTALANRRDFNEWTNATGFPKELPPESVLRQLFEAGGNGPAPVKTFKNKHNQESHEALPLTNEQNFAALKTLVESTSSLGADEMAHKDRQLTALGVARGLVEHVGHKFEKGQLDELAQAACKTAQQCEPTKHKHSWKHSFNAEKRLIGKTLLTKNVQLPAPGLAYIGTVAAYVAKPMSRMLRSDKTEGKAARLLEEVLGEMHRRGAEPTVALEDQVVKLLLNSAPNTSEALRSAGWTFQAMVPAERRAAFAQKMIARKDLLLPDIPEFNAVRKS